MQKFIFTFWEPENRLPGYIRLCMETWKKFLPDYTIINCNYNNLHQYLSQKIIDKILYKDMSLPMQADCLRPWLLKEHGGGVAYWLDADTVVTGPDFFDSIEDKQCCMIGIPSQASAHMAFIYTRGENSEFISKWADEVVRRVAHFRKVRRFERFYKKLYRQDYLATHNWDFVGNAIINTLIPQMSKENYTLLDRQEIAALPEYFAPFYQEGCDVVKLYTDFYFKDYDFQEILKRNKGIILLHNSWTPTKYKEMSEVEFLSQDITLAKMLKYLLGV